MIRNLINKLFGRRQIVVQSDGKGRHNVVVIKPDGMKSSPVGMVGMRKEEAEYFAKDLRKYS